MFLLELFVLLFLICLTNLASLWPPAAEGGTEVKKEGTLSY